MLRYFIVAKQRQWVKAKVLQVRPWMTTRELAGKTVQTWSNAESLAKSSICYCSLFFWLKGKNYEQSKRIILGACQIGFSLFSAILGPVRGASLKCFQLAWHFHSLGSIHVVNQITLFASICTVMTRASPFIGFDHPICKYCTKSYVKLTSPD